MDWTFIQAIIGILEVYEEEDEYLSAEKYAQVRGQNAPSPLWVSRNLGYWGHIIELLEGETDAAVFLCSFCPANLIESDEECDFKECLSAAFESEYFYCEEKDVEVAKLSCDECEYEMDACEPMELILNMNEDCPEKGCEGLLLIKAKEGGCESDRSEI